MADHLDSVTGLTFGALFPASAGPLSDSLTVFDQTGAIMGQVTVTEAQETANGAGFTYIINQNWADPMQQVSPSALTEPGGANSDVFGVTNGAVAGCTFMNGCLGFESDTETVSPGTEGTIVMPEGTGVFLATRYLSPALRAQGWTAVFVSDVEVPEPTSLAILGFGALATGLIGRLRSRRRV